MKKKTPPPLKPTALINFKKTDAELAKLIASFWQMIWGKQDGAIDQNTRYLLSLSNAVGARRFRQATREFIKAYAGGVTIAEFDELFCLFVWNQGAGEFASEIGPSPLFGVYQLAKGLEAEGVDRAAIVESLTVKFGEKNPEVATGGLGAAAPS